jgi:hypothetical protein
MESKDMIDETSFSLHNNITIFIEKKIPNYARAYRRSVFPFFLFPLNKCFGFFS